VRSIFAASFPLFSRQLFNNIGIQWASTLLGCFAVVLIPIPVCFWFFGLKLRQKSQFAPVFDARLALDDDIQDHIPGEGAAEEETTGEEAAKEGGAPADTPS
jgi:MFS transporter, DHA1 family, multidrug resistance protein